MDLKMFSLASMMVLLFSLHVTAEEQGSRSSDEQSKLMAEEDKVDRQIKNKFREMNECMKKGQFWNVAIGDCQPCDACENSTADSWCFLQCQGTLNTASLHNEIQLATSQALSRMDKNNQEIWIAFSVISVFLVMALSLAGGLCCYNNTLSDQLQKTEKNSKARYEDLEKKFDRYVDEIKNNQRFNQPPDGDNVPPSAYSNANIHQPSDENERLFIDEEASDSGVSDPTSSRDTGL